MRIPKRVNTVLDWMEEHRLALGVVVLLVAIALVATLAPISVGIPAATFILGIAVGGFTVHVRSSRRIARVRAEVDNLLRENGALRHRNTVLASGVITREAQETQALMSIPEDDLPLLDTVRRGADDTQATATLDELLGGDPERTDELPDELPDELEPAELEPAEAPAAPEEVEEPEVAEEARENEPDGEPVKDVADDPQRTTVLPTLPDDDARGSGRARKKRRR
ncbi:hypothetical protein BZB76_2242 [Actinomadura pelletieri DSM 43383]|uniref:Uncharacterized protein n=1 Tax=Actinomadura pelletieri DSM 43383 TaxID=1120940 RepID=A0A495QTU7_9ACTN|nr:hypothetical protein [Actinomadura pelletieri]RKS76875.1 hypothetical protein BZB76_2242 [Actinomadura pelletieri DSM 43383]